METEQYNVQENEEVEHSNVQLLQGNCLELMKDIEDKSIDMILCDLPYGTTACKWDIVIPFDKLWEQYNRIIKDKGIIILNSTQPFTSNLIISNKIIFKYTLHWNKKTHSNPLLAKKQPLVQQLKYLKEYRGTNENIHQ